MVEMVEFLGTYVPSELCTIDAYGDADDFCGCGNCDMTGEDNMGCENCIVLKLFNEYAKLTKQNIGDDNNE